jgi:hypothetical protein
MEVAVAAPRFLFKAIWTFRRLRLNLSAFPFAFTSTSIFVALLKRGFSHVIAKQICILVLIEHFCYAANTHNLDLIIVQIVGGV